MSFRAFPLWLNVAILIVGGVFVWGAGSKLAKYTDAIATKTGLSREFLGALMLGGMTSLPELAVTVSAALLGNAHLAVNNLLGGITMQVAILAVADVAVGAAAISTLVKDPVVRLQGALLIVLLSIAAAGILVGEPDGWRVGPWSMAILAGGVVAFFLIYQSESHDPKESGEVAEDERTLSLRSLVLRTIAAGAVILGAGYAVAVAGDALGEQSGLGASFVGFVLVAVTTSLPELSTTIGAARIGRHDMAFSNIFGTNVIDLSFVGLVDILWARGPVLDEVGKFSAFAAVLAIAVTGVYIAALVERRNRSFLRMGIDSILVLVIYLGGTALLYGMRDQ